jgi:hypothetical protein
VIADLDTSTRMDKGYNLGHCTLKDLRPWRAFCEDGELRNGSNIPVICVRNAMSDPKSEEIKRLRLKFITTRSLVIELAF